MGGFRVRHLVARNGAYYFQATPAMRAAGIFSEALGRDLGTAVARAEYLNAQWSAARLGKQANPMVPDSVAWLIREFEKSDWYDRLAPRTKEQADHFLNVIADSPLGRAHVAQVARKHARQFHDALLKAKNRTYANKAVKWLRRLMSYAVELELRKDNPAFRMDLRHEEPRRMVWTPDEVEAFKRTAIERGHPSWALAVQLAYDTSQRLGDILALTWTQFDGEGIAFRQAKTGAELWCKLHPESLRMLHETKKRAVHVITGDVQGKPIKHRAYFARIFREIRAASGIRKELTFHDLRRTAATEASAAGANVEHLTGHKPGSRAIRSYVVPDRNSARRAHDLRYARQKKPGTKV